MPDAPAAHALDSLLEGLNEPQREAVAHGDGPLLILAGAGSGKTRVLTHRIAHLVGSGRAQAGEILAITFTNKAASEMRDRVEHLVGARVRAMWVMTFHAACARMLRADAPRLGYTRQFTIYDQADARRLTKRCLDELGVDPKRFTPAAIHHQVSDAKNKLRDADAYAKLVGSYFEQTVADVFRLYERELHRMNAMDFDDLLVRAVNVLELFPEVRERYAQAFRHVLVDEYQDTNHAQYRWLGLLAGERRNLAVVGDDDQCLIQGTPVTMADGSTRPIERIRAGDLVLSCQGGGTFRPARVTGVAHARRATGIAITTRGGRRLVSTPEHTHFAGYKPGLTPHARFGPERERPRPLPRGHGERRRDVTVTLCGDPHRAIPGHRLSVSGHDRDGREALERAGLSVGPARRGSAGWRHETSHEDYGELIARARSIGALLGAPVRPVARLGREGPSCPEGDSLPFVPAASVRPGMVMFTEDGSYDVVERVDRVALDAPVYDLDVEHTHNFIADGLPTHNSVYGFRGADVRNILDFEADYPDAKVIKLEQNYRSTQTILSAANAVVRNNRGRRSKTLWTDLGEGDPVTLRGLDDEHAEARFVAGEIERVVDEGVSRAEIAVFYRTNAQSRVLEDTLVRAQIGYQVIGGTKFYERAEIKDAIAYLTVLVNPQDVVSFTRIVSSPRRGIGQTSLSRVIAHANTLGEPVLDVAADPGGIPGLGAAAVKAFERFMGTMRILRERAEPPGGGAGPIAEILEETLQETGYLDALQTEARHDAQAQGRIENLEELVEVAREYDATSPDPSLGDFLQQVALVSDADTLRDDEGLVTLMTLHNAKGLEFPIVFMIGCEEGIFPHSRALDEGGLEEERRLCYVGITRAQRDLYMTWARTRNVFGSRTFGARSRFVEEVPAELTDADSSVAAPAGGGWATRRGEATPMAYRMGQDVAHAAFGEGVITAVEPGGIVVVRFARDGIERKLVAELAPLSKR